MSDEVWLQTQDNGWIRLSRVDAFCVVESAPHTGLAPTWDVIAIMRPLPFETDYPTVLLSRHANRSEAAVSLSETISGVIGV